MSEILDRAGISPPSPIALHEIHGELERLLAVGQAPVIALHLEMRFLQMVLAADNSAWMGWGFPIALSFARRISAQLPHGLPPEDLDAMDAALRQCAERPVPPWPGASQWHETSVRAIDELATSRREVDRILAGEVASAGSTPKPGEAAVWVPVVAEPIDAEANHPLTHGLKVGMLLRLGIRAQIVQRDASRSELTVDGPLAKETREAFESALRTLARLPMRGAPAAGRCWFRASWDISGARMVGRSASLAFLAAAMAGRSGLAAGIASRAISPVLALTGDLDGTRVAEVEAESLPWKVRAAFFGHVGVLGVPWDQRETALREVRRLEERHSGRQLVILGVRDFSDIWHNATLVGTHGRGTSEIVGIGLRRLAASRAFALSLVLVLALLAGLAGREVWISLKFPAVVEWEGEDLVARNAYGRPCFRRHLPPGWKVQGRPLHVPDIGENLAVSNLDGRRGNEVLANVGRPTDPSNDLVAFTGHGKELWRRPGSEFLPGGEWRTEMHWRFFCRTDLTPERGSTLIGVRRSTVWATTLVDRIDSATGVKVGMLRNQGHLEGAFLLDVNRDRVLEIALTGTHNPTSSAMVILLDPQRMAIDPSWRTQDDVLSTVDPGALDAGVLAAFRFPADRFGIPARPHAVALRSDEDAIMVAISVDGPAREVMYYLDLTHLDAPLSVRVVLPDGYRHVLAGEGRTRVEIADEEERLAGEVLYLTPEGWKPVPRRMENLRQGDAKGN